jgi:hypothetical protein
MSLETLFIWITEHRIPVVGAFLLAPWITGFLCYVIPGRREEPVLLSLNLWIAVISLLMWVGYLTYTSNTGGWSLVVKQADVLLLLAPPYYAIASLWVSRQRVPLHYIPAFQTLQGLVVMGAVYFAIAALFSRIRIYFFSYLPFSVFLWLLAGLLGLGYWGYCQAFGRSTSQNRNPNHSRTSSVHGYTPSADSIDAELEQLRQNIKNPRDRNRFH